MKKIIRIAKVEFSILFFSPVAWLLLIVFIIQTGVCFLLKLRGLESDQHMGYPIGFATGSIFSFSPNSVFPVLRDSLFYYIPLLTMGLISRETSSGSIKLLYSSPVKIYEFVLGKFTAVAAFSFFFITILLMYILAGIVFVENFDWPFMLSGILGLYLLMCTYTAIGLFISSLTNYQAVAAIVTLVILGALHYVGEVWQYIDFIRDLTYNLSLAGRMDYFIGGLVTSRELIYFLVIIAAFLYLTVMRLTFSRQKVSAAVKLSKYALLLVCVTTIGYVTSRPGWIAYWDLTATKGNTLSKAGQEILKRIKEPFEVTTYVNLLDPGNYDFVPDKRNIDLKRLELYQRFRPDMKIKYVNFYDFNPNSWHIRDNPGLTIQQVAEKTAKAYGKSLKYYNTPSEVKKMVDLSLDENYCTRAFSIGNKTALVRGTYGDNIKFAQEKEVITALETILTKPAELHFVTGHNEREVFRDRSTDLKMSLIKAKFRESLCNLGFVSKQVSLAKEPVPDSITALVIPDPRIEFTPEEFNNLRNYINRGGNLVIMGEVKKKDMLNNLLAPLGLRFADVTLLSNDRYIDPDYIPTMKQQTFGGFVLPKDRYSYRNRMILPQNAGGFLRTDSSAFNYANISVLDTSTAWTRPGVVEVIDSAQLGFFPHLGDKKDPLPNIVKLTRKINNKEQKITVLGDADIFSMENLDAYGGHGLFTEIFTWTSDDKYPVLPTYIGPKDNKILVGKEVVLNMRWVFYGFIPAIIFITAAVFLIKRKRK